MKYFLSLLSSLFLATGVWAQYPTAIDQNTSPGQTLRAPQAQEAAGVYTLTPTVVANPTLPNWLQNASVSLVGVETTLGLPSSPASGSVLYQLNQINSMLGSTSTSGSVLYNVNQLLGSVGSSPNPASGTILYDLSQQAVLSKTTFTTGTSTGANIIGTIYTLGDSYIDDAGNLAFLNTGSAVLYQNSNGPSFGMIFPVAFGQPQGYIGRWTPAVSVPNTLGNCYAIAGAAVTNNLVMGAVDGLNTQVTKILADYPSGFAPNTVILISIGINDMLTSIQTFGGQWTMATTSSWTVSGTQTCPAAGSTMVLNVTSSTGASAGATNYIDFVTTISGSPFHVVDSNLLVPITAVGTGTISFVVPAGAGGATIASGSLVTPASQRALQNDITALGPLLTSLTNAGATVILCSPPDISYLPQESATVNLAHWTFENFLSQLDPAAFQVTNTNIRIYDLNPLFSDMVTNPSKYGNKNVTSAWNGSGNNPNDYMFWDNFHPTAKTFRIMFKNLLDELNYWGYATY